ncbi:jg4054 [Pararge aegeria aegeria]|uniref:Jg4054 protein n=1 Tax=Pararge aegeria aegeria TaxID=348720 RepID=A0A8S4R7E1_9NEOP|nr:jg4054 [Pararge aegeria aegeria]
MYPFNAQFPYNLTLRSKRNFAKSFPAAAAREARASETGARVPEIKCWAKLVTLRLSISKPIRSKVCAKMTSKGNHTPGRRPRPTLAAAVSRCLIDTPLTTCESPASVSEARSLCQPYLVN